MEKKRTVAVLGASTNRHKFGNKSLRAHHAAGWEVYPINPQGGEIEGLVAYTSLAEVPVALDRVTVYLPPPVTLELIPEIAAKGAGEIWLNPGAGDAAVHAAASEVGLRAVDGCSIIDVGYSPADFP